MAAGSFPFPEASIYPTYAQWQKLSGEEIEATEFPTNEMDDFMLGLDGAQIATLEQWNQKRDKIRDRVVWGLGDSPPYAEGTPASYGAESAHLADMLGRDSVPQGPPKDGHQLRQLHCGRSVFPDQRR